MKRYKKSLHTIQSFSFNVYIYVTKGRVRCVTLSDSSKNFIDYDSEWRPLRLTRYIPSLPYKINNLQEDHKYYTYIPTLSEIILQT